MRDIKIGDKTVRVAATPVTLFIYKKEFGTDLVGDLIGLQTLENDPSTMDSTKFLQMAWAMAKTANMPNNFPDFVTWLSEFDYVDFSDDSMMTGIVEEAEEGFFRNAGGHANER